MRIARLGAPGAEVPVVFRDGHWYDLRPMTSDVNGSFLASGFLARVRDALDLGELEPLADADGRRIGAPVARPGAVICIGMNYAARAAESDSEPPKVPIVFLKTPNTVVGPDGDVTTPRGSAKTD
ncbi:hypothetical protein GCM10010910_28260 [Microbacterium nanhaiense]|uniref:Fumarylacetoacetase-like C-terminal domain-containing protein n=1 Tax=Microbacterium nanhaiense TaxID=1301026 RepID=A0ABQ2N5N1_9MICO|nr:hypothetical protein GCM10010910_28260 [Microbacterium nanhaiense]